MKISNESKVGVVAAISITMLILGYNLMKGNKVFSHDHIFYAKYGNAQGLAVPNHVRLNGMSIGNVARLGMSKDGSRSVIVMFTVDPSVTIPKGSIARINTDALGTHSIEIELSTDTLFCKEGDTLNTGPGVSLQAEIGQVTDKAKLLIEQLDSLTKTIHDVLDKETKANLQKSIQSVSNTLNNLDASVAKNTERLNRIFANVESITANIEKNQDKINAVLGNLQAITDSVAKSHLEGTINEARNALTSVSEVMKQINNGKGTLGMLVNDDKLYNNLEQSSKDLAALIADLNANPGKYTNANVYLHLFGKPKTAKQDSTK